MTQVLEDIERHTRETTRLALEKYQADEQESKKISPRPVLHRAAVAHTHDTECRTERESLKESAVDKLLVGLREANLYQCLFSIVLHNNEHKARLAITTLINLFSTNNYTYFIDSINLYQ